MFSVHKIKLIDSHCHLDDDRYDINRTNIIKRAKQQGVEQIILPATTAKRWEKVKQIAKSYTGVFPAYGLHPMFMQQHDRQHIGQLDEWLDRETSIAVGECGLDFFASNKNARQQIELFNAQLQLAKSHHLPVIVHVRKALDQVISLLRKNNTAFGGVIHSFSGSLQQAQQLSDLGFKLGIAATVSFDRAQKLRAVVTQINADTLLLESDAPDQPGIHHRGELNQPAFIVEHLKTIAQLRGISEEALSEILNQNTRSLFKLENYPVL